MYKYLYIIEYENAHWCGGQLNVCVWAESAKEAEELAAFHMTEKQYELFYDEYEEEPELQEECLYVVNSVEKLNENHECWKYFLDPVQRANFYPVINSED